MQKTNTVYLQDVSQIFLSTLYVINPRRAQASTFPFQSVYIFWPLPYAQRSWICRFGPNFIIQDLRFSVFHSLHAMYSTHSLLTVPSNFFYTISMQRTPGAYGLETNSSDPVNLCFANLSETIR